MAEEPHWAQIICYLYESETGRIPAPTYSTKQGPILPSGERERKAGITTDHPFVQELEMDMTQAANALSYAIDNELLVMVHNSGDKIDEVMLDILKFSPEHPARDHPIEEYSLSLSRKGFEVAHGREMRERQLELQGQQQAELEKQNHTNALVGAFTIVLATGIVAQALFVLDEAPLRFQATGGSVLLLGLIGAIVYLNSKW